MIVSNSVLITEQSILLEVCGINNKNIRKIEFLTQCEININTEELIIIGKYSDVAELTLKNMIIIAENGGRIYTSLIEMIINELMININYNFDDLLKSNIEIVTINKVFNPRTVSQAKYVSMLNSFDVVFSFGPAGTGKTFLSICYALQKILNKESDRLVITRPVVEAGENLGYLPGDITQKINPYLIPLYDAINQVIPNDIYSKLTSRNAIEVAPLAYMRGRTFENSIVILDEAQNTTCSQMKMFLTRLGSGSKLIINGDITQIDLNYKVKSGMVEALKVLKNIKEVGFMEFTNNDVVRHPLVKKIISSYENHGKE